MNLLYTDIEDDTNAGFNAAVRYAAFEETTPKHRANLNLGWANEAWSVDGFARYEGDKKLYYAGTLRDVDAHVTVGGRVAREFDNGLTFALSGQNLLNERQRQTSGLEAERRAIFSISKSW